MIIRKTFKFEASHMVRNCYTDRCKSSLHGHSFLVEVFLKSKTLDNGGMTVDFSIIKNLYNDFIDSFDHSYMIWNKEKSSMKNSIFELSERWVILPVSPSAESLSILFLFILDKIIKNTKFANGEKKIEAYAVRVHETTTGYAEAQQEDLKLVNYDILDIIFSNPIMSDWKNRDWQINLTSKTPFILKEIEQQIK